MEITFKIVYGHAIKMFYLIMVATQSNPELFSKLIKSPRGCSVLLEQAKKCWLDT